MAAPKLQFAFQGGGAKFISMLPIAAAIRDVADSGVISLSSLAGTSAGSICCGLIAAKCDFKKLVKYLREEGDGHIERLCKDAPDFSANSKILDDVNQALGSLNLLKPWTWRKILTLKGMVDKIRPIATRLAIDGYPVLDDGELNKFITKIFTFCSIDVTKRPYSEIESYGEPKLLITASDILNGDGVKLKGNLLRAIVDSCSVPLALRSFNYLNTSNSPYVDGGLCNNLPVDYLESDKEITSFIVYPVEKEGIKRPTIDSIVSYFLALISCPIDYNVKKSKLMIDDAFHIPVEVDFSTFGFKEAIEFIKDEDKYNNLYSSTKRKLTDFVNTYGNVFDKSQVRITESKSINDYINCLNRFTKDYEDYVMIKKATAHFKIYSVDTKKGNDRAADTTTIRSEFQIKKAGFRYYRGSVKRDNNGVVIPTIWWAVNITRDRNKKIPIHVLALEGDRIKYGDAWCMIEFLDSDKNFQVGDEIEIANVSYRKDAFADMNEGKSEFCSLLNPHSRALDEVELKCTYPAILGGYKMIFNKSQSATGIEGVHAIDITPDGDHNIITIGIGGRKLISKGKMFADIVRTRN